MASAALSTLAGSLLSPLRDVSLGELIRYLLDYLSSSPSPSSPDEAEKQQQLKDSLIELEDAKLNVKLMQTRIMRLFEKHKQNERVVSLHNKLKQVGYDILDLESEMKYMELERKVEEINKADQEADTSAGQSMSRRLKRLIPFRLPTSSSRGKKRRLPTSSQCSTLFTDDAILASITSIIKQCTSIHSKWKEETMLEGWLEQITLNGVYDPWERHHFTENERVTTSSTNGREIYGRKKEIRLLIEFLKGPNANSSNVSVAPIVGMGGLGKTTLAQFVFNHTEIEDSFDKKGWVCVSDRFHFDRFRIIREMVDIINPNPTGQHCSTTNLDLVERQLESQLKMHLRGKKFLLVLDDVWSDKWQQLLGLLRSTQAQAIKIFVTCREPTVLRSTDQGNKIILEGIDHKEYWSLFMDCASAQNNPELHETGRRIVEKLMGSPLAAKTVGKLLGSDLTEEHWNHVLENDLWKLKTDAHDIMPALALSYYHLPPHLQPCFAFCSALPNGSYYDIDDLVGMWIANGYVSENGRGSKTMHDVGEKYCNDLLAMFFFDKVDSKTVKMHDLMHDLAQLVSHGETCVCESGKDNKISENVRHFCGKVLTDLRLVCKFSNIRTLVLLNGASGMSALLNHGAFNKIRVLVIKDDMEEFPDATPHLKHLQYLDLTETGIQSIPDSLCELYQLRVLKLPYPWALPGQFHNLINLEILRMDGFDPDKLEYHVKRDRGFSVAQLRNMNELRGPLSLEDLENIDNREEAMKAKLKEKRHIKKLHLSWKDIVDDRQHAVHDEVLEGLEPHPNLQKLRLERYMGSKTPSWLKKLQKLKRIYLSSCRKLACLPAEVGSLHSLEELHLSDIENITIECESCDASQTQMFPSLQLLSLEKTTVSFTSTPTSSSVTTPVQSMLFPHLQILNVKECEGVNGFPWPICPALKELEIRKSPGLDDQLPGCLHGLSSLTKLELEVAKIKTFPAEVMATLHALEELKLTDCNELLSTQGLQALPSLRYLYIFKCHKFTSWCTVEMAELRKLSIVSCQDLESLPAWLCHLRSLNELSINRCPTLLSLPKEGLPSSLEELSIISPDPGLMERCQQEGSPEWRMIQRIPKTSVIL